MVTVSSFGKDVASVRTKGTTTTNIGTIFPSTRVIIHPLTSNKRNAIRTLAAKVNKHVRATLMDSPLNEGVSTSCNVLRGGGATMVRVTTTTKLPLLSGRRHGPLRAAACNIKRLVQSTVQGNYERFVIKVNNDTAGSNKIKVLSTLKFRFLSGDNRPIQGKTTKLTSLTRVQDKRMLPILGRYAFQITYSIRGSLYKRLNYDDMFKPRGNTSRGDVQRVSR